MSKFNLRQWRSIRVVNQWRRRCKRAESQPIAANVFILTALALIVVLGVVVFSFILDQPKALGKPTRAEQLPSPTRVADATKTKSVVESAQPQVLYRDIYLRQQPNRIIFGNGKLKLEFDRANGQWLALAAEGIADNLITAADIAQNIDFQIDGNWAIARHGAKLLHYETAIDRFRKGVTLNLTFGVAPRPHQTDFPDEFELTAAYTLFPERGSLARSARLRRNFSSDRASVTGQVKKLEGFLFGLPGVGIENTALCVVDAPGPFLPKTYVAPQTPYKNLVNQSIQFHRAPDGGLGILAMTNKQRQMTLASWMETSGEVAYNSTIRGDGRKLSFWHENLRAYRLPEQYAVTSDIHHVELTTKALPAALAQYRQMLARTLPLATNTPQWAREMVLLEVYPPYFPEGFKGITKKLSFYRNIGFNTIYLMPHWVGGYSPIDLYQVEPSYGTSDDLRELVRTAHTLGMKVLFDMVIHGFDPKSPIPQERPDLFVRDEQGNLARHREWGSISTDWASPAYQQYMVDLVLHDLKTYDIDGYRVDAAGYKGPSWDEKIPYPAYRSGSTSPELMQRMLSAMQAVKPETVLLSEIFGPVFYSVSNLVHDNQTEAGQFLLDQMAAGKINAQDYKAHIANVLSALPAGANRVYFTRNHDTSWFYHFNGYTPRLMAMEAVHALFGIPEVFAGDPKSGSNPDDNPATYDFYRRLFLVRRQFSELVHGEVLLREVECDNPWVFTGLRRTNGQLTLVIISFSADREDAKLMLNLNASPTQPRQKIQLIDPIQGENIEFARTGDETNSVRVQLKPFQILVGRLS
jgi:glycosidase